MTERLKNVQGDAEREGTIRRITDWLVNALGQSDTETGTGERAPQDVGDPSAEQTPSTNDPTGLQEEPPDQSRIPTPILELGRMLGRMNIRELGARLYSVVAGESGEPSEEPIADPTEEAQPESAEADDGGIPEATGADDESGPTLARAQRQVQELEDELVELEERIETLSQWRQESAPEELSGIEDVKTRQEELKQRLDRAATRLQGLEPDPEPADQGAADEAGEPSPAPEVAQAVAELEDIRDALAAQDGRVSDLEDQRVTLELRSIAREVVEEIGKAQTRLQEMQAEHAEEARRGAEFVEQKRRELERAKEQVILLGETLDGARARFRALQEESVWLVGEKIRRQELLKAAEREADEEEKALQVEKGVVWRSKRALDRAEREVGEWETYVERVKTLQREHDVAARYYRAQIAHYGNKKTEYVHLFDGGTADNLGFTPLLELLDSFFPRGSKDGKNAEAGENGKNDEDAENGEDAEVPKWKRETKRIGIIAVDARTSPGQNYETRQASPNMLKTLITTVGTAIDSKSFLLGRELRRVTEELEADKIIDERYIVEVSFDGITDFHTHAGAHVHLHGDGPGPDSHIHAHDPDDRDLRLAHEDAHETPEYKALENCERQFRQIPTSWNLSKDEILALIAMGKALVRDSQTYRRLVAKYVGKVSPSEETVAAVCAEHLPKLLDGRPQITAAEASDS